MRSSTEFKVKGSIKAYLLSLLDSRDVPLLQSVNIVILPMLKMVRVELK